MSELLDRALDLMVVPGFSRVGYTLRRLSWEDASRHTISGRTALVTGGSSGVGEAACEGFAAAGARVHMLVRNRERGEAAVSRIESRLPGANELIEVEVCDLSRLADVRRFAESFQARFDRLDVLVHNAGVLPRRRTHTAEGVELTFATNVLGPFLLTSLLLPSLLAAGAVPGDHGLLGRHVHGAAAARRSAAGGRGVRRRALLRAHQARAGRPQPHLGEIDSGRPDCFPRHAPGLGRHSRPPHLAASLPAPDGPVAARRAPGGRHGRLAGDSCRTSSRRPAGSGTTARPAPSTACDLRARPPRTASGSGVSASALPWPRGPGLRHRSADARENGRKERDGEIHGNGRGAP